MSLSNPKFIITERGLPLVNNLLTEQVNNDKRIKPAPSRIDYNFFNYCSTCELKYPKEIIRCDDCNQKIRTRPWHRSNRVDQKRI